ncbi:MAG: hypothetical protein Q4C55_00935 [Eubacterium sp.]|nr:hypothetical protein [Eubacterium sp.]
MKQSYLTIKLILIPYIILGVVILCDLLLQKNAATLQYVMHYFVLSQLSYILTGVLLGILNRNLEKIYALKSTKIIILCNLCLMLVFYIVGYLGISFFINIKNFVLFDFILIGYYVYLLVCSLKAKK